MSPAKILTALPQYGFLHALGIVRVLSDYREQEIVRVWRRPNPSQQVWSTYVVWLSAQSG